MHLTDEQINKFLDNELNHNEIADISTHLKSCNECLNKLKAFQAAENELKSMILYNAPADFTLKVMARISSSFVRIKKSSTNFFRVIFSIFIIAALGICVAAFSYIPAFKIGHADEIFNSASKFTSDIFSSYKTLFSKQIISVLGSIVLFSVIALIYFVYDSQKNLRDQINKLK